MAEKKPEKEKKHRRRGRGEGTVFQRKDGRWVAEIALEDGKRKPLYGKTQEEVIAKLKQAEYEQRQGMLATGPQQTMQQFLEHWIEHIHKPRLKQSSYITYRNALDAHIIPALGHIRIQKLKPEQLEAFYAKMQEEEGLSAGRVQFFHAILHRALKTAVQRKRIARNPCDLVEALPRIIKHESRPLTPEQAQKLLEIAQGHRLQGMLAMAVITGVRLGELTGLQWKDIDFEHNYLQIRRTVSYFARYGYVISEPKSTGSRRKIILPVLLVEVLKQHRTRQLEIRLKTGATWVDGDLVFCNTRGGFINPSNVRTLFREILKTAGLQPIRFHDLRHSAATILLSMGIHPKVVQELLGHSKISMTMDTYSSVLPSLQGEAMEKIGSLFQQSM